MPLLHNPEHERFAEAVAKGARAAEAYREVYPRAKASTAETRGPELARREDVAARVAEFRTEGSKAATDRVAFEIADAIAFCVAVLRTPIGQVDENHPLCQEWSETETKGGHSRRYKMPSKEGVLNTLSKLKGWFTPEKHEISGSIGVHPEVDAALRDILGTPQP